MTCTGCQPELPQRIQGHINRARQFGLTSQTEFADNGYLVRISKPHIDRPNNAAEEFANAEGLWIVGDWRQIRRVEWRTQAGIKPIRVGDIGPAIAAVAL